MAVDNASFIAVSNFSSLFEVAIGLNLVFAVWEAIRNQALNKFRVIATDLENDLALNLGENYKESRCATKFLEKQDGFIDTLEALAVAGKWSGVTVSAILVGVLIYIGYYPETSWSPWVVHSLVSMSVLVSPAFVIIGNYHVSKSKSKLEEFKQNQTNAMEDIISMTIDK